MAIAGNPMAAQPVATAGVLGEADAAHTMDEQAFHACYRRTAAPCDDDRRNASAQHEGEDHADGAGQERAGKARDEHEGTETQDRSGSRRGRLGLLV